MAEQKTQTKASRGVAKKPDRVNIVGTEYSIEYCDKPSEVDIYKCSSLWGQIDPWTRSIRVYDKDRTATDIWHTILHEIIHGIATDLHLSQLKGDDCETTVDVLALALIDVLTRNGWLQIEEDSEPGLDKGS